MNNEMPTTSVQDNKFRYFLMLGLKAKRELKIHKKKGPWGKRDTGADWRNVREHCAVEAARVEVLADLILIPDEIKRDLVIAAWLHDAGKKREVELTKKADNSTTTSSFESYIQAEKEMEQSLLETWYSNRQILLATSMGFGAHHEAEKIVKKNTLSDVEKAFLIMHYIDDITRGSEPIQAAEVVNGGIVNDLDRRMQKNANNPTYFVMNEEGRAHFGGLTIPEAQRQLGHEIEARLYSLVKESQNPDIFIEFPNPENLPEIVESQLNYRISQFT